MIRAAQSVYFTALGLWVGGLAALGAIVAPTVFKNAPSRADAGRIFGAVLRTFGYVELALAALVLVSGWILRKTPGMRWGTLRTALVGVLCILVLLSVFLVDPQVGIEAKKVESLPLDHPDRASFNALHRWSERLAGATLLMGLALLVLSGASLKPPPDGA